MGKKQYELTNHLGNVLAVVSDTRTGVDSDANGSFNYYEPDVLASNEYYPFGMNMPGSRSYALGGAATYRYGFSGKEKDPKAEWGGLNHYDYGFRIYNPAIGRFLSVDPLAKQYPMLTPYQFASNCPVWATDIDGLEAGVPAGNAGSAASDAMPSPGGAGSARVMRSGQLNQGRAPDGELMGPDEEFEQMRQEAIKKEREKYNAPGTWIVPQGERHPTVLDVAEPAPDDVVANAILDARDNATAAATSYQNSPQAAAREEEIKNSQTPFIVYRAIRPSENPDLGLSAPNPDEQNLPEEHVRIGSREGYETQWISTTKSLTTALFYAKGNIKNVVRIDLTQVQEQILDVSQGFPNLPAIDKANIYAKKDQEILVRRFIPAAAITRLPLPPTKLIKP